LPDRLAAAAFDRGGVRRRRFEPNERVEVGEQTLPPGFAKREQVFHNGP